MSSSSVTNHCHTCSFYLTSASSFPRFLLRRSLLTWIKISGAGSVTFYCPQHRSSVIHRLWTSRDSVITGKALYAWIAAAVEKVQWIDSFTSIAWQLMEVGEHGWCISWCSCSRRVWRHLQAFFYPLCLQSGIWSRFMCKVCTCTKTVFVCIFCLRVIFFFSLHMDIEIWSQPLVLCKFISSPLQCSKKTG